MLVKKLIPLKFLGLMIEIVISALMLATKGVYPALSAATTDASFIAGCSLILAFSFIQIIFTLSGVNIYSLRIHFENLVCSWFCCVLLAWFCFGLWPREYVWLIWGFLCIYPVLNELFGMISNICHNKRLVFQKYRSDN